MCQDSFEQDESQVSAASRLPTCQSGSDEFADHKYFAAEFTAYRTSPDMKECVAIYAGEKSRRNPDGTKSAFLRFPALIVSEYTNEPMGFAETVAEILQENAHRFYASAQRPIEEARRADDEAQLGRTSPDTNNLPTE